MWDRLNKLMLLSCVIGALALPAAAAADEVTGTDTTATAGSAPLSPSDEKIVGEDAQPLEAGLYEIPVPGPNLITHGPDSERAMSLQDQRAAGSGSNIGFDPGHVERNTGCARHHFPHLLSPRAPPPPQPFA